MNPAEPKDRFNRFKQIKRRPVRISQDELVRTGHLDPEKKELPLVIEPNTASLSLADWAASSRDFIERRLLENGALLFRNFDVCSVTQFERVARSVTDNLLDYSERAAPRTEVGGKIYTSTEYPADHYIPLHHEMSYSHNWPKKIFFFCAQTAEQGGRTPIADDRKVFNRIDPKIRERFMRKKVMYVRNYGEGVDMTWQEVFQTNDRAVVEEYCRSSHMEYEWKDRNRLRTRYVRQAVVTHPQTGDTVWFNHAHMFHVSSLEPAVREALLSEFKEDELPRNAFYGDGSSIETSVLDEVRETYEQSATRFTWQNGDILLLDNFLVSHGRERFAGPRRILVALAELHTNTEV